MATVDPIINVGGIPQTMTAEQIVAYQKTVTDALAQEEARQAAIAAQVAAKESAKAKLAALGLTEEEVNAIIGGV